MSTVNLVDSSGVDHLRDCNSTGRQAAGLEYLIGEVDKRHGLVGALKGVHEVDAPQVVVHVDETLEGQKYAIVLELVFRLNENNTCHLFLWDLID